MGLDTSHNCWHGPYSSFTRWRHAVAKAAGYHVYPVKYDDITIDTIMLEWHRYREYRELQGTWDETPADPLIVLFAHSDCDGVIHPTQAGPLAEALADLLPKIPPEYLRQTEQFIAGLRLAVERGEDVHFH